MLFKLSVKNIRKSIKNYAIYFFTLIVGVAIFYVFNAIGTQSVLLEVSSDTREIMKLMTNALSGISVFVSFILGLLIIYASRFLIKRRNKEFGVYLTLGMGKRKVSMILFLETFLIGLFSLVIGLLVGVCASQLMSILVANMFEADLTKFEFVFSSDACMKTVIYFGIIYLFVMLFNTLIIGKCKLIDLLQASRKNEKVKMKNPILCVVVFIIAAVALGYAYYIATVEVTKMRDEDEIYIAIILGAVSTLMIFWSLSGLVLRIIMSFKKLYFRELNSFTLRQISSKINTTVVSMTLICLMLFMTICILSSAVSIKNSMNANIRELAPADIQLRKEMNVQGSEYHKKQKESSRLDIFQVLKQSGYDLEQELKDKIHFFSYETEQLTLQDTLGNKMEEIMQNYKFLKYGTPETIIRISDYNQVAKLYGNETFSLKENEYLIVADFDSMVEIRNEVLKEGESILVSGRQLKPKYDECKPGFVEMSTNHINWGIIIVPDSVIPQEAEKNGFALCDNLIANYKDSSEEAATRVEKKLNSLEKQKANYLFPQGVTKKALIEGSIGLGAMITFIGLYLGIIFLIASATILALKELSESADNIERYQMLRKIGADEKMISKALFRQIGIFFMLPLLVAGVHSIFGIRFCAYMLETFGNEKLLSSIVFASGALVLIYGGYFAITYLCSKNMIQEK